MTQPAIKNALSSSLRRLVNDPLLERATGPTLRGFLLLLENPAFREVDEQDTLKLLCKAISRVTTQARAVLVEYLTAYPVVRVFVIVVFLRAVGMPNRKG